MDPGHGPIYGHAASRDFTHWARLPVAIWNDQSYDNEAIFTGSTTVVNGKPIIVYPGLCNDHDWPNCTTGTNLNVAVPTDPTDPLYINWSKPSYNPIVNNTQRDPSTAWLTPAGEWRFTTYDTMIYTSTDFVHWSEIGKLDFEQAECPSFFPLPAWYPGSGSPTSELPTHVRKQSSQGKDWMIVGTYVPGAPGTVGMWNQTPGYSFDKVLIDAGDFYASKDFYDPVKGRRINFGWARVPPASTQTLAREVRWHVDLKQLVFSPVEELEDLRGDVLYNSTDLPLSNQIRYLGNWQSNAGNQSEVLIRFKRPTSSVTFGVDVMTGPMSNDTRTRIFVEYDSTSSSATVGVSDGGAGRELGTYMEHTDLPGGDFNVTDVKYSDPHICQSACLSDPKCEAWTYVTRPPLVGSCCQKLGSGWGYNPANPTCVSGVRHPEPVPAKLSATLNLLPSDTEIELRVFVDNTFVEAYWMDGRVAMTSTLISQHMSGMSLFADDGEVTASSTQVWSMKNIWVSADELIV